MTACKKAVLAISLLWTNGAVAQSVTLSEDGLVGKHFRVTTDMNLTGEMKILQDDKSLTFRQAANARHEFIERILEVHKGLASKSARVYRQAEAVISSGDARSERHFRPERTFMVCQRIDEQPFCYCPKETHTLTREEIELSQHFDSLAVSGLLPGRQVKVGDSWEIANLAVQSLCYLDGLTSHDLKGTLDAVNSDQARITVTGVVNGIDLGAAVKLGVQAECVYDVKVGRIVELTWKQTDEREPGPLSPELKLKLTTTVKRTPIEPVNELNDFALVPIPTTPKPPESLTRVAYIDPDGRFELTHGRDWQAVARTSKHLVLRLLERGDFVAQATLTPWKKAEAGSHLSADEVKQALENTPGWEEDETLEAGEIDSNNDNFIYRIAAAGTLNEVKVVQYFYLVAGPQGDQLLLTFTLAPAQTQKLAAQDLELVRGIAYPRTVAGQLTSQPRLNKP